MSKTAVISARIDPKLKHEAEEVFRELGLTATQAITLFYKQVELERGLPFAVRVPNAEPWRRWSRHEHARASRALTRLTISSRTWVCDEDDQEHASLQERCQANAAARQGGGEAKEST
jgi:DNA-damage-inducible protein J